MPDLSFSIDWNNSRAAKQGIPQKQELFNGYAYRNSESIQKIVISLREAITEIEHYKNAVFFCTSNYLNKAVPWFRRLAAGLPPRRS
jgi:hypothetical protein